MQKAYQKNEHEIYLENEAGERIAEILFPEVEPKIYCIQRTFVDDSLRGQGVAGTLMELAVQAIQEQGGTVTATCSYAQHWLEKHAKEQHLINKASPERGGGRRSCSEGYPSVTV